MPNPTCVFYTTSAELRDVAEQLESDGTLGLAVVTTEAEEFLGAVSERKPELVFADLGFQPDAVLDLVEKLPVPGPRVLVTGPHSQSGAILRAMRLGVREYFDVPPSADELRRTLGRLAAEIASERGEGERARVVAVMGAKGGVGATAVACQLAASLRRAGARTAIVDLVLPLGDVALFHDVQPAYTLAHISRESQRLDGTFLRTLLQSARNGVELLAAPTRVEESDLVRGAHVERVLELLRQAFDWIVLDVSRSWSEPTVRALDLSDQILLVTLMDVPTLHHTRQHLDLLERLGHAGERVRLVANRYAKTDAVTDRDVAGFLEREPDFRIPNDYRTTVAGVNRGLPVAEIAPRSPLARAYEELAASLATWTGEPRVDAEADGDEGGGGLARAVRGIFRRT